MWQKFVYCVLWTVALLTSTFLSLVKSEKTIFNLADKTPKDLGEQFLFPYLMAMTLFLLDVIYETIRNKTNIKYTYISMFVYMLSLAVMVAYLSDETYVKYAFYSGWVALFFMKLTNTQCIVTYNKTKDCLIDKK